MTRQKAPSRATIHELTPRACPAVPLAATSRFGAQPTRTGCRAAPAGAAPCSSPSMDTVVLKKRGYSLGDTLGEGSYGKVKAAYSHRLKRKVAIKIIDKKKISQNVLEKFLPREMEALMRLHHPSIIETYEIFETSSGKVYIVMELGEKGSLLSYLTSHGAMDESVARGKFQQLASAIKHCHDLDFAHRDLKCDNILLDNDLNFKLSDFGFSKPLARDENGKTVLSSTFCGSLAYSAPELLEHIPCDPRISDMWSLGIILYAMLFASQPLIAPTSRRCSRFRNKGRSPSSSPNISLQSARTSLPTCCTLTCLRGCA